MYNLSVSYKFLNFLLPLWAFFCPPGSGSGFRLRYGYGSTDLIESGYGSETPTEQRWELTLYLEHLLSPLDVQQNVGEGPDGVRVPPHHHVGKSRINKIT